MLSILVRGYYFAYSCYWGKLIEGVHCCVLIGCGPRSPQVVEFYNMPQLSLIFSMAPGQFIVQVAGSVNILFAKRSDSRTHQFTDLYSV